MRRVAPALYVIDERAWRRYWHWLKKTTDTPRFRANVRKVRRFLELPSE